MSRLPRAACVGLAVLAAVVLAAGMPGPAAEAQDASLVLRLRRTFGYALGGDVQGSFAMIAEGPPDLARVTFYVDATVLGVREQPPFRAQLHTGDFPLGPHRLSAEGTLVGGEALRSNVIQVNFVAASASLQGAGRILAPILAVVGVVLAASVLVVSISSRRYRPGVYGSSGGAVCPHCGLPMSRHFLAPNMGGGRKLERCPHCRRWSRVRRAPPDALTAAEARLLGEPSPVSTPEQQADELRRRVDESRFSE
jgi:hypothetical protein